MCDNVVKKQIQEFLDNAEGDKQVDSGDEEENKKNKQIIRDYVESIGWNKQAPAPKLPAEVIEKTVAQYRKMRDTILKIGPKR